MSDNDKLALHGGNKIKTTPYGTGCKHDIDAICAALRKRIEGQERLPLAMGESIKQLRSRMCEIFSCKHAIPVSSGTAAIHAGLAAIGIKPGDEVITTPSTDHGTVIGIMQLGAIPVFADVDPDTLMIEAHTVEPHITERTRAILPVHFCGCPTDMTAMMALANKHNLLVLEDAAQSWLAEWDGRKAGTYGNAGAISFNESKHVTTGEGGVVLTDDDDVAKYADAFVDKAYNRTGVGPIAPFMPALNLRMSEINAVLGILQLDKVQWLADRRYELGQMLADATDDLPGIRVNRPKDSKRHKSSYWHGVIHYDPDQVGVSNDKFIEAVAAEGILCYQSSARCILDWPLFRKLNEDPQAFAHYRAPGLTKGMFELDRCPNATRMAQRTIQVHLWEWHTNEDMEQTAAALRKVSRHFQKQTSAA
jgi:dTDP-4-amino-4,6-dideoxygalactose transaminase